MNEQVPPALVLQDVCMDFRQGKAAVLHVLTGVNLTVKRGETVGLVGPSGSGKSTLLHIAGLLETPTGGEVTILGRKVAPLNDDARTAVRRNELGFVYQFHHLLPEFSALENIMMPQLIAGVGKVAARARAFELLRRVGLADRASHRPAELSGGEQQRVAIMRALANGPKVLLADEPTGNLDQTTAGHVMMELLRLAGEEGVAVLIATHDMDVAGKLNRVMQLREGVLQEYVEQYKT